MHCEFEPAIQYDCVKSVIEIAREGDYGNGEIAEAIQHASCFAGCAAKLAASFLPDGDDDDPDKPDIFTQSPMFATGDAATIEDICQSIENCIPKGAGDQEADETKIDWTIVFNTLWPLLLSLIQKLINSITENAE